MTHTFELLKINTPTASGNIYTHEIANKILGQILVNKITIQQERFNEKKQKGIELYEPVARWAMADVIDANIDGDSLMVTFKTRTSVNGKTLNAVIDSLGINKIVFFPVGVGNVVNNIVQNDYKLYFIAFEEKKEA